MKKPYAFHFGVGTCRGEMREVQGGRSLSTFQLLPSTSARQSRRAFTLIEGFGVLASRIGSMRTKASSVIGLKPFFDRRGAEGGEVGGKWKAGGGRGLSTFHLKPAPKRRSAFTLIELLGVMAIIGILAAVLLPSMISRIEDANSVGEDAKLEEIARALVAGIKASGTIPNPNRTPYDTGTNGGGWGDIAYKYTTLTDDSVNPGTLHYVFAERTQDDSEPSARRVYLDDQFMAYLVAASGAGVNGVFQTPAAGWPEQAGGVNLANIPLRMYIVSSSKKDLSLSCQANQSGTGMVPSPQPAPNYGDGLIGDLQNWVKKADGPTDPAPGAIKVPDGIAQWGSAYAGGGNYHTRGEFLHVKTVDLRPLFCRVNLREFPYPQSGTTQTGNPGAGYTAGTAYSANIGSFSFSFLAPGATFNNPGPPIAGTIASSIALSGTRSQITRNGLTATPMSGIIPAPGGGVAANFDITINNPPWWDISPPAAVAGQQMPNNANTQSFYVIKGTSLSLYTDGTALPSNPVLTVQINADTTFEYFNDSWTRVD